MLRGVGIRSARSRAATATISAPLTFSAGLITAAGAMRAAPRIPIRTPCMLSRPDRMRGMT